MGSASGPDDARRLDADWDGTPEPLNQTENRASDHRVDDRFYEETDGVLPQGENDGYLDDPGGPIDGILPGDPAATAIRETVVAREEERFGGIKIGSAFFGWLVSTAMAVLLVALVEAGGRAGFLPGTDPLPRAGQESSGGMTGMIVLLSLQLLAYFSGGYVAGRMARFNGVGQGLMVWIWGVIGAATMALLAITGQYDVLTTLNRLLRLPLLEGQLGIGGIIAAIAVAATALIGAVLGGLTGVHYHRRVDRAGFTPTEEYYQP
ncbi:hypothetical protein [Arthrobacter sp. ov118]|uniref:hypothetical protein n=1 Tax=Arthrobacter sp. ov118 TaxID=1761747 RepID=UPI0008F3123D|nr:hypothetical protein [Arthrobacter sp. ov118]SFU10768.1 hypothetical protein SAMN04487915_11148 [Arthrobacter sp. ov118]